MVRVDSGYTKHMTLTPDILLKKQWVSNGCFNVGSQVVVYLPRDFIDSIESYYLMEALPTSGFSRGIRLSLIKQA